MEKKEAKSCFFFFKKKGENENAVYCEGVDSYANIKIPNILPNQVLTISAEFELPVTFPTKDTIKNFHLITSRKKKIVKIMKKMIVNMFY